MPVARCSSSSTTRMCSLAAWVDQGICGKFRDCLGLLRLGTLACWRVIMPDRGCDVALRARGWHKSVAAICNIHLAGLSNLPSRSGSLEVQVCDFRLHVLAFRFGGSACSAGDEAGQLHLEHGARARLAVADADLRRGAAGRGCGRCTVPGRCRASRAPAPAPAARSGRRSCGGSWCGMPRPLSAIRTTARPSAAGRSSTSTCGSRPGVLHRVVDQVAEDDVQVDAPCPHRARLQVEADRFGRHAVAQADGRGAVVSSGASATSSTSRSRRPDSSRPASSIWLIRWSSRSRSSSMKR